MGEPIFAVGPCVLVLASRHCGLASPASGFVSIRRSAYVGSMPTLAHRDLDALLRFVHDASTLERDAPVIPEIVTWLHQLVPGAETATYCEIDWDRRRVCYIADDTETASDLPLDEVLWEFRHQHAIGEHFRRTGDLRPRMMSDMLRPREWRALDLYNLYFAPMQYELKFGLPSRAGYTKMFLFHSSRRDFEERDRLVVELLRPHLQRIDETFAGRRQVTADVPLTRREREVLAWVERGKTNAEIAQILWIAPGTVKKHLDNVYEKLGVRTRTAAVTRLRGR
jgi:DNA-binding CsgD family transcriptional regulator